MMLFYDDCCKRTKPFTTSLLAAAAAAAHSLSKVDAETRYSQQQQQEKKKTCASDTFRVFRAVSGFSIHVSDSTYKSPSDSAYDLHISTFKEKWVQNYIACHLVQ
jgi:hypothetical protein